MNEAMNLGVSLEREHLHLPFHLPPHTCMHMQAHSHTAYGHTGLWQVSSAPASWYFMLRAYFVHETQESGVSIPLALSFVNIGEDAVTKGRSLGCIVIPEPFPEGFLDP